MPAIWLEMLEPVTKRCPAADRLRVVILDSMYGPAEEFEHVSTTAPSKPPTAS